MHTTVVVLFTVEQILNHCHAMQNNDTECTTMQYTVRPAKEQDLDQIASLYNRSFPEHIMVHRGFLNNPEYLREKINNKDEIWAVEEENGTIRGVAALGITRPVGLGEIERVCVDIPYRGNGVAKALCEYLTEQAVEQDLGFVESWARGCQPGMQKTFENLGFSEVGISARFEIIQIVDDKERVVREKFVHYELILKPDTIKKETNFIPKVQELHEFLCSRK